MEPYLATMFEDIRHNRSLILLISLTDPDTFKQSKITHGELKILKNLAPEKLHRQRLLKEYVVASKTE